MNRRTVNDMDVLPTCPSDPTHHIICSLGLILDSFKQFASQREQEYEVGISLDNLLNVFFYKRKL